VSNGWPLVPMEDIFEIARGGSPRPIDSFLTDDPDGVNWVMISDATESGKYINSTKKRIREEGVKRSRVVQPGDFLLTNSMSFGRPYIMNTSGCIHDGWLVLSPRNQNVSPDFFYHLLGSDFVYAEFVRRAAGATVKNLNIDLVKGVQVPLPPMPEQRRIAEVLDRAEVLRAKRRTALAQLDALTQSIFLALFGDPATNPKGWPVGRIGDLLLSATYGTSEKASTSGDFAVLRMNNITRTGEMDFNELKYMDLDADEQDRYLVMQGDVLFNRTNSADLVGKTAIFREVRPMAYAGYLVRLRVNAENDPEYLACFLNTGYAKKMLRGMCKSIIGMANINAKEIQAMRIAQPPNDLQRKFARHVAAVGKLRAAHRASLVKLDNLFSALQHRAFRGEL
jgi:type I restriction enzyme, S subunit